MAVFQHILWGYELTYPDDWVHQVVQDSDGFAATVIAFDPSYTNPDAGHLLVRGEWNWKRQPIEPLWNDHVGLLAGMLGAKEVGSAPWKLGEASGLEAEIVLPKKENQRLWTGILMRDFRVLHFMASHPREVRKTFEPQATNIISSLRFPERLPGIKTGYEGVPLPPDYSPVDPGTILSDISNPENWRAYHGSSGIGALQAFYLREIPIHNWDLQEYVPFPGLSDFGFCRFHLRRGDLKIMLGLMPYDSSGQFSSSSLANIVFKVG
jgi:hypothetical protein